MSPAISWICDTQIPKANMPNVRRKLRIVRRRLEHDQDLRLVTSRQLEKFSDPPLVIFILCPYDHEQMPASNFAVMRFTHYLFTTAKLKKTLLKVSGKHWIGQETTVTEYTEDTEKKVNKNYVGKGSMLRALGGLGG